MTSEVRVYQREQLSAPCRRILVANAKGGSGKSTVSTNLAAALARMGYETALVDADPQQTSTFWMNQRTAEYPVVFGVNGAPQSGRSTLDWMLRVPRTMERVVIDSPGGIEPIRLGELIERVDIIVIPLLPSAIDIHATTEFIKNIFLSGAYRNRGKEIVVVGNRVNRRNKYFHALNRSLNALKISDIIHLPDSYVFLRCVDEGMGVIDLERKPHNKEVMDAVSHLVQRVEQSLSERNEH